MSLKTHPNFKSVVPEVRDAEAMNALLSEALIDQDEYEKKTTTWEAKHWDPEVLERFEIKLEKIDRLYFIDNNSDNDCFAIMARLEYEEESLYVTMIAYYNCCFIRGSIFITKDANIFIKVVIPDIKLIIPSKEYIKKKSLIYSSFREDGIYVEDEEEENHPAMGEPYTLKYLCHELIYENRYALLDYKIILPKILARSVSDFIKTRIADIEYHCNYIPLEEKDYEDFESILIM